MYWSLAVLDTFIEDNTCVYVNKEIVPMIPSPNYVEINCNSTKHTYTGHVNNRVSTV